MPRAESAALFSFALLAALSSAYAAPAPSGAKAPACKQEDPSTVTMASSGIMPGGPVGGDLVGLKGCVAKGGHIICSLALTQKRPRYETIPYPFGESMRDNNLDLHKNLGGTFYNRHCAKEKSVDLDKDDWVWFTQEFDGPTDGVTSVKLLFWNAQLVLESPVEAAQ